MDSIKKRKGGGEEGKMNKRGAGLTSRNTKGVISSASKKISSPHSLCCHSVVVFTPF